MSLYLGNFNCAVIVVSSAKTGSKKKMENQEKRMIHVVARLISEIVASLCQLMRACVADVLPQPPNPLKIPWRDSIGRHDRAMPGWSCTGQEGGCRTMGSFTCVREWQKNSFARMVVLEGVQQIQTLYYRAIRQRGRVAVNTNRATLFHNVATFVPSNTLWGYIKNHGSDSAKYKGVLRLPCQLHLEIYPLHHLSITTKNISKSDLPILRIWQCIKVPLRFGSKFHILQVRTLEIH